MVHERTAEKASKLHSNTALFRFGCSREIPPYEFCDYVQKKDKLISRIASNAKENGAGPSQPHLTKPAVPYFAQCSTLHAKPHLPCLGTSLAL